MKKESVQISAKEAKRYFKVKGMTCRNCESRIIQLLKKSLNLGAVHADYAGSLVFIQDNGDGPSSGAIVSKIREAGYEAREISRTTMLLQSALPVAITGIVLLILALIASETGLLNNIPEIRETMSYPILFVVGLMTSVHCIGMCGGIGLSQTAAQTGEGAGSRIFKKGVAYNLGRLTSYTLLGGLIGGIGSVLSLSLTLQGTIVITAGVIMIILGLRMLGVRSFFRRFIPLFPSVSGSGLLSSLGKGHPYLVGLLNGLMPCGPLQSMQIYALSTGSVLQGAFSMFLFSAGTIPLMLAFGTAGALFSRKFQKNILRISALLVIFLGGGMIQRGLSLQGVRLSSPPPVAAPPAGEEDDIRAAVAEIRGDVQVVFSTVERYGYEPIIVQAGIPVQWYLVADTGKINGCNNAVIIPRYNITQGLTEGETLVEFMPEEAGYIPFSCWMGMIHSGIHVVEDLNNIDPDETVASREASEQQREQIQIPVFSTEDIGLATVADGHQRAELTIGADGYSPSILVMRKGVPAEWVFTLENITDANSPIIFPAYNAVMDFSAGESSTIELVPSADFFYHSQGGEYLGFVLVLDDIAAVSEEDLLAIVQSYLPQ